MNLSVATASLGAAIKYLEVTSIIFSTSISNLTKPIMLYMLVVDYHCIQR